MSQYLGKEYFSKQVSWAFFGHSYLVGNWLNNALQNMSNEMIIKEQIEKEVGIVLQQNWQTNFHAYINHLINTDFEKLVFLLYRIDVSEKKIKALLDNTSSSNAGELIAQAIIERLEEKKVSREKYKQSGEISEDEKW